MKEKKSKHNASSTNDRIKKPHQENQEHDQHEVPRESIQYCSFFNNGGKCTIAERLGRECRFIHKLAPMCNFDTQCVRPRCMFRHTHRQGGFLGQRQQTFQQGQQNFHQGQQNSHQGQQNFQPGFPAHWMNQVPFPNPWGLSMSGKVQQH